MLNSFNNFRWSQSDKFYQQLSTFSDSLGWLAEYSHIAPPVLLSTLLASPLQGSFYNLGYLIIPNVAIKIFNDFDDVSKRKWVKKEIKQICNNSSLGHGKKKLVYVVSSVSSGIVFSATNFFKFRTKSDIERLAKEFEITFIEAKTKEQLERKVSELSKNSVDAVIIQAHGNQNVIQFSKDHLVKTASLGVLKQLAEKLKKGSTVSLLSCYAGRGNENIAKEISKLFKNSTIYSPSDRFNIGDSEGYRLLNDASCFFLSGHFLTDLGGERKDITKIYRNSRVVTS